MVDLEENSISFPSVSFLSVFPWLLMKAIAFYVYHVCWCMPLFTPQHVVEFKATSTTSMNWQLRVHLGKLWHPTRPTFARAAMVFELPTNRWIVADYTLSRFSKTAATRDYTAIQRDYTAIFVDYTLSRRAGDSVSTRDSKTMIHTVIYYSKIIYQYDSHKKQIKYDHHVKLI